MTTGETHGQTYKQTDDGQNDPDVAAMIRAQHKNIFSFFFKYRACLFPIAFVSKVMAKVIFFSKVGQKSRSMSRGQNLEFKQKGHTTRNTY